MTTRAPTEPPPCFLDTSGVIWQRHGHTLQREAVREAVGDSVALVSNFIRMEYLRAVVVNLIELYFLIKESASPSDALIDWSEKVQQERKVKIVLRTLSGWITAQEEWTDKDKTLRRLGEFIVRLVFDFDDAYPARSRDLLRCQLGRVTFPRQVFNEEMLVNFHQSFRDIQSSTPDCHLCRFREQRQRRLTRQKIDLCSSSRRQEFKDNKGFVQQAERLETALTSASASPSCRWCERLGDTVIILQAPAKAVLVTADRAFEAFGQILGRSIRRLPSLAELKRQVEDQMHADQGPP